MPRKLRKKPPDLMTKFKSIEKLTHNQHGLSFSKTFKSRETLWRFFKKMFIPKNFYLDTMSVEKKGNQYLFRIFERHDWFFFCFLLPFVKLFCILSYAEEISRENFRFSEQERKRQKKPFRSVSLPSFENFVLSILLATADIKSYTTRNGFED